MPDFADGYNTFIVVPVGLPAPCLPAFRQFRHAPSCSLPTRPLAPVRCHGFLALLWCVYAVDADGLPGQSQPVTVDHRRQAFQLMGIS